MSTQKTSKAETKEDVAKASTDVVAKTSTDEAKTSKGVAKTNKDEAKTSKDEDKTGEDEGKLSVPCSVERRKYATRGTKGTFGGRRPPKHPALLAIFEKQKAEYLAEKEKQRLMRMHTVPQKRCRTPSQLEYQAWQRTFNRSTSSSSRVAFVEAAAAWQVERAKQISQDVSLF